MQDGSCAHRQNATHLRDSGVYDGRVPSPQSLPQSQVADKKLSALPSPAARAIAFVGIVVAGLAGALIGSSMVDLQCSGSCGTPIGIGILIGALVGAGGMSVVSVLGLRAIGEWRELQDRESQKL